MLLRLRGRIVVLIIISSSILSPIQISAEEEWLIVRIIDADYPPRVNVHEEEGFTGFTFYIYIQIENPCSSPITIPFVCGPYPFPYLRTDLRDKNLRVYQYCVIEWVAGEYSVQPGIKNETYKFYFTVEDYINESLPLGIYELWMDYTNCSSSPVPVVKEKMFIEVSETNITYFFEYDSTSIIVFPTFTLEVHNYLFFFMTSLFTILTVLTLIYRKKNQMKIANNKTDVDFQ